MMLTILLLAAFVNVHWSSCTLMMALDGNDWHFYNANKSISGNGQVPGSIHTDLRRQGTIEDPYYRFNDDLYAWIGEDQWTYEKSFKVDAAFLNHSDFILAFGGVDTVAEVFLNGKHVGSTANQFQRYFFSVKNHLKVSSNILTVAFQSPVKYADQQSKAYPYDVPPDCPPPDQHGQCHFNFIRKSASSFSWDWGPSFPTVGLWRNVTLRAFSTAAISYVTAETWKPHSEWTKEHTWRLNGTVFLQLADTLSSKRPKLSISVEVAELNITGKFTALHGGCTSIDYDLLIPVVHCFPTVWMPNGHGQQKLYNVKVTLFSSVSNIVDQKKIQVGFREVKLVQEPIPTSTGLSFYFTVNDVPIFMKGSNWIPAHSFQGDISTGYLRHLLTSAKDAHMNMLRVWGGGIYESEEFYALADELGIMIWQDFMFACALYPSNEGFLDNVRDEVTHQIRRLKRHPSIAVWAGNNENEGAIANNWYGIKNFTVYDQDYVKLYIDTVRDVVLREDKSRPFVPSSPSNGVETMKEGWIAKNPQDVHYGDIHHYDYSGDSWNYSIFPIPRFASEYGLQSWCSLDTLRPISKLDDWNLNSEFVKHRQHHPYGNDELQQEVLKHMALPTSTNKTRNFLDFIYLTQINQAVGIKTETELYRRMQSSMTTDGRGHTMGALYWQLNDIWQAPTWASIEFGGAWKMLHYYAVRFFHPYLISPFMDPDGLLQVYFIHEESTSSSHEQVKTRYVEDDLGSDDLGSDDSEKHILEFERTVQYKPTSRSQDTCPKAQPLTLDIAVYKWDSFRPTYHKLHQFNVLDKPSALVYNDSVKNLGCSSLDDCVVVVRVPECQVDNWYFVGNFSDAKMLMNPELKVVDFVVKAGTMSFTVKATRPAAFVWLESHGCPGVFSDNGFMMFEESRTLTFSPFGHCDLRWLPSRVSVGSLWEVYHQ